MGVAKAKSSLAGGRTSAQLRTVVPVAPPAPSIAMRYSVPERASKVTVLCGLQDPSSLDPNSVRLPTAAPV